MFRIIKRKLGYLQFLNRQPKKAGAQEPLSLKLETNLDKLQAILGESDDITYRRLTIGLDSGVPATIVFIDGLADKAILNNHILRPLMQGVQLSGDSAAGITGGAKQRSADYCC